jgi:hypothetical protein
MDVNSLIAVIISAIIGVPGVVAIVALTKNAEIRTGFMRLRARREDDTTDSDRRGT